MLVEYERLRFQQSGCTFFTSSARTLASCEYIFFSSDFILRHWSPSITLIALLSFPGCRCEYSPRCFWAKSMNPFIGRRGLAGSGQDVWRVRVLTDFLDGEHCADVGGGSAAGAGAGRQCLAMVLRVYAADLSSGVRGSSLGVRGPSSLTPMGWVLYGAPADPGVG